MNYHVAKNGAQLGQMPEEEIVRRLQSGDLASGDLCWTDGMGDWVPLGAKFALQTSAPAAVAMNPYAPPSANVLTAPRAADTLELADRGTRLGAALIEGFIFVIAALPILISTALASTAESASGTPAEPNVPLIILGIVLVLALAIYQLVMLATRGQSIGKRIVGIRIVTHPDGANPGGVKTILMRGFIPGIISNIPLLGFLFSITNICFIFREDRRCIHDLIAGTQVVKGQPPQ
jgi:uncharacterized RDD family membrane protein YckC